MQFHQRLYDIQSQSYSAIHACCITLGLRETLKNHIQFILANYNTGILYFELNAHHLIELLGINNSYLYAA